MSQAPDPPSPGNVRATGPGALVLPGAVAAVVGWAIRPLCIRLDLAEPVIAVWGIVVIWVAAAGVGVHAFRTWQLLQREPRPRPRAEAVRTSRLEPYQAVNRLVLGKAAAVAGAVVLGGYAGFAIAHLGIPPTELSTQRLVRAAVSAGGGLALMVAGLLLERACRVRSEAE